MEYRTLPHGGEKISVIGLGAGSLSGTKDEMVTVLNTAIENGINYFDLAPSIEAPWHAYAEAFAGRRDKILTGSTAGPATLTRSRRRLPGILTR